MGNLSLVIGSMFSSKSTHILNTVNKYSAINKKIFSISHILDLERNKTRNLIKTHNNQTSPAILTERLSGIENNLEFKKADLIIIDESQFFPDLFEWTIKQVDTTSKDFLVCGLQGDFQRKPLGEILNLIPHADQIIHFKAFCKICSNGTLASFTKRITNDVQNIKIGSDDIYMAVCRKHFLQ